MRLEHDHVLRYPREQVWEALTDPEVLARVLPGVEKLHAVGADRYDVVLQLGVPAVKGSFSGCIEIAERDFPARCALRGQGKGAPGWARGSAQIALDEHTDGTRVTSRIDAQVGGRIAGVGQRMLEGVGRTLAHEMFEALDRELAGRAPAGRRKLCLVRMLAGWLRTLLARSETANPNSRA